MPRIPKEGDGHITIHREFAWPLQGFWTMVGWPNLKSYVLTTAHMALAIHVLSWHGGLYVYHPRDTFDSFFQHSLDRILAESILSIAIKPASFKKQLLFFPRWLASMPFHTRPKWEPSSTQYLSTGFPSANHYYVENPSVPVGKKSRIYEWVGSVTNLLDANLIDMLISYIFDMRFSKKRGSPGI